MFNSLQFKKLILQPTLTSLLIWSEEAFELMLFTCAAGSLGGTFLHEINGAGIGIYNMQPEMYNDIWTNFINYNLNIKLLFLHHFDAPKMPDEDRMIHDLKFATGMAWIQYARFNQKLPTWNKVDDLWEYYNKHFNKYSDKIHRNDAIKAYLDFI